MDGEYIRIMRTLLGISQKELAKKIGVHFTTVNRIEKGHSDPQLSTARKIQEVFDRLSEGVDFEIPEQFAATVKKNTSSEAQSVPVHSFDNNKKQECIMVDCGNHIISKNVNGEWERLVKATGEVEVEREGRWLKKRSITPPPP